MITFSITNKHRPTATIIMLVGLFGKQYRKSIGVGVPEKYWNAKKKRARVTADYDGDVVNQQIDTWEKFGKQASQYFIESRIIPSAGEFSEKLTEIANAVQENPHETLYFCDYFENTYIERYKEVRGIDTQRVYRVTLNKLRAFEARVLNRKLRFEDINIDFYNRFQAWFYGHGFSRNYFGNIIKVVRQVYKEARIQDRLHDLHGTEHRQFLAPKETADAVYLSEQELQKIVDFVITEKSVQNPEHPISGDWLQKKMTALRRAKGLFLIGCYTGLRVSDFSRLSEAHVNKYITIKTIKTGAEVVIPIHPIVRQIIDSGFDLTDTVSDQKLNDQIKELCRLAGITQEVLVNKNVGGQNTELILPKYKLVSSHTARRSFATNAYKAGVPTIAIMKITGHTKESTFLKYIKVSAEENAAMLSNHPFFNTTGK